MNFNPAILHFAEPRWLWPMLLALSLLFWLQRRAAVARREQLDRIASPNFVAKLTGSHSPMRRQIKELMLLSTVALMGLALARPQWGEMEFSGEPLSEDLVFVLDCSRSMMATDVQPDRLSRAKSSIVNFVRRHAKGRVGLIAFSGGAFLQCPLTFDYNVFEESVTSLDARSIPVGGTDIGHALEEAYRGMDKKSSRKLIMLLTDGEDLEKSGVKKAESLAKEGVVIFCIGVGTPAGAEIRAAGPDGRVDLVRDEKGQVVRSRLDETTLRAIAQATGGDYQPLGRTGEGMVKLSRDIELGGSFGVTHKQGLEVDRFYIPLAIALLLLVLESLLGTRRSGRAVGEASKAKTVAAVFMLLGFLASATARAHTNDSMFSISNLLAPFNSWTGSFSVLASNAKVMHHEAALVASLTNSAGMAVEESVPAPTDARGYYNAGTRKMAAHKLDEAELMFQNALDQQEDTVQPVALYNIGCVRYDQGVVELKKAASSNQTIEDGRHSLESAASAIKAAEDALTGDEVPKLVAAYRRGRGAQREMYAAFQTVRKALEIYGRTLEKWRLSLTDFRGSVELDLPGTNAVSNAAIVDREIAKLVDKERQRQMMAMQMAGLGAKLQELRKQIKGKIPKDQQGQCTNGEQEGESEDEGQEPMLFEQMRGPREVGMLEGSDKELSLSPEQAARLLDNLTPGSRRLSMTPDRKTNAKDPKHRDW